LRTSALHSVALRVTHTSPNISYSKTSLPVDNPHRGSGDFHEKAVMSKNISTLFFVWKAHRWQGGSGSRFHTNSLARAVHDWIRCPCGRSVTILLAGSPCGGSLAGPSSLQDQRPFQMFLLKAALFLFRLVQPSVATWVNARHIIFPGQIQSSIRPDAAFSFNLVRLTNLHCRDLSE
jgi:hypothetical protein